MSFKDLTKFENKIPKQKPQEQEAPKMNPEQENPLPTPNLNAPKP
jgi:hypothetical protein